MLQPCGQGILSFWKDRPFLLDFLHNRYNDNLLDEITLLIEALVEQQEQQTPKKYKCKRDKKRTEKDVLHKKEHTNRYHRRSSTYN